MHWKEIVPWQKRELLFKKLLQQYLQCQVRNDKKERKIFNQWSKTRNLVTFPRSDVHAKEKIARGWPMLCLDHTQISCRCSERFTSNLKTKDLEEIDYCSLRGIKKAIERGIVWKSSSVGEEVSLDDAIIILSCGNFGSKSSRDCSPNVKQKYEETSTSPCVSLDLNLSIDDQYGSGEDLDIGLLQSVDRCIFFQNSRTIVE
ncbi:hypothetical protein HAX54_009893 [Datura stramonium]|uniref:Uncharacterized protein n=1 Tax=Datura stramonium TaxID=4076 RepID=A0ABS8RWG4_DATST|nr:hypothetical protein [Datura stramonium]